MGCQSSKALGEGYGMYGSHKETGAKINIYKQDPAINGAGTRITWVPTTIKEGPANDDITTMGMSEAFTADSETGDLLFNVDENADACDAAHTFAIVQHVITIYRRALKRTKLQRSLNWQWGNTAPIQVLPHAGDMKEAYYNRDWKALAFFNYEDSDKGTMYTCRSWDVVAHETGHAILDSLKPMWLKSTNVQTAAIHEAFGDITAIFMLLDQLDMCESLVTECKGDLHNKNILGRLSEEFGSEMGRKFGLRNTSAELTIKDASAEVDELSRLLTTIMYDVLVGFFDATRDYDKWSPAESLFRAGQKLCTNLLLAILACPEENPSIRDLADKLMAVEQISECKKVIKEEFKRRGVFAKDGKPKAFEGDIACNACGTMKAVTSKELEEAFTEALKVYLPEPVVEKKPEEGEQEEKAGEGGEEPKANGEAAKEGKEEVKENDIKAEEAVETKEAPKAEPEQMVNGNASPEEATKEDKTEEKTEEKKEEKKEDKKEEAAVENGEVNEEADAKETAAPEEVKVEEKKD